MVPAPADEVTGSDPPPPVAFPEVMSRRAATPDPAPRPGRSWPQRILLTVGVLLSVTTLGVAGVAGWMAYQWRSVDRAAVDLDAATGGPANYLVVGSDSRSTGDPLDPSAGDTHEPLADTILLVRVDPATRQARVLSLPRDLWVTRPDGGRGRINGTYNDGPQDLVDTIRRELDVPVNHYVEVDFTGFQELVEAVDGVPMWFDRAMRDDNTGLDVLHPGCVTLDGRSALAFARSRHLQYFDNGGFTYDGTGDLGRISRQQVFLRRVIDRTVDQGITNPNDLRRLVQVGTSNLTIDDNLSISQLLALGQQFASFDSGALQTLTLPTTARTTDGGAQVVDLDPDEADAVLDLFRPEADELPVPETTVDGSPVTVAPADVDLVVLNSSGEQGLAAEAADDLVALGFVVDRVGNGDELGHPVEDHSLVRHAPGADADARAVATTVAGGATTEEDPALDDGEVVLFIGDGFGGVRPADTTVAASTADTAPATPTTAVGGAAGAVETAVVGMVPGDPPPGRSCG